jgi:hypothetical protein
VAQHRDLHRIGVRCRTAPSTPRTRRTIINAIE